MIKYLFAALFTCVLIPFASKANTTALADSVGTVVKNGKSFTIHEVAPKETIYALARQYKVSVSQIQQANPGVSTLAVGQTIFVPGHLANSTVSTTPEVATTKQNISAPVATPSVTAPTTSPAVSQNNPVLVGSEAGKKMHTVEPRQTLFAVARLYNVSTNELKKWNNLTSDNLREGQTLLVAPNETGSVMANTPSAAVAATTADKNEANFAVSAPPNKPVARREEVKSETTPVKEERTETRYSETMSRVSESGLAEVMDQKGESNKYLALHKTAPVGTILQVRNAMNNQSVYVRVSGKLPEGTANDKIIIKVSKRACQKLAATDNRFRVEVNYMP